MIEWSITGCLGSRLIEPSFLRELLPTCPDVESIPAWTPLSDPLLAEFWDPRVSSTIDEVANAVSEWRGRKANTPLVQASGTAQPLTNVALTTTGLNMIRFDGLNDLLEQINFAHPQVDFMIFMYAEVKGTVSSSAALISTENSGPSHDYQMGSVNGSSYTFKWLGNNTGPNIDTGIDWIDGDEHIFNVAGNLTAGTKQLSVDAVEYDSDLLANGIDTVPTQLRIGSNRSAAQFLECDIADIIITAAIDTETKENYEGFLAWKNGGF